MLFLYLIKVSFLLAVLTLSYRMLVESETFSKINRFLLIINVMAAWALPILPLPSWGPVSIQKEFHQSMPVVTNTIPSIVKKMTPAMVSEPSQTVEQSPTWDMNNLIISLYTLVVICMSGHLFYQLIRLVLTLRRLPSQKLKTGVTLIFDEKAKSPYSFFNWIVVNPKIHSATEMEHILAHETEHVKQLHGLDLLLSELQRILLWFNPFAWLHRKLVQENLEYLVDHSVLKNGYEKKRYQFNLLNVALQSNKAPLSNSFTQSLLKKRIKMMNKKPSGGSVLGKYALLLIMLYASSAFVAPYRQQIANYLPESKPILQTAILIPSGSTNVEKEHANRKDSEEAKQDKIYVGSVPKVKSKWVMIKGDTLYWAVSPMSRWEDIQLIKEDITSFGSTLNINGLSYDPLQTYITSLTVKIKSGEGSGEASQAETDIHKPSEGLNGYFIKNKGFGFGSSNVPAKLVLAVKNDYQNAMLLYKENKVSYFEKNLTKNLSRSSSSYFKKSTIEGIQGIKILEREGIGRTSGNLLLVSEKLKNAEFYLNAEPSNFQELNHISFDQFVSVNVIEGENQKKYISVKTK